MHTKPLLFIAPIDLLGESNEKFELKKTKALIINHLK